jgi:fructokinase
MKSFIFLIILSLGAHAAEFGAYYTKVDSGEDFEKFSRTSDEELPTLARFFDLTGQVLDQLQGLRQMFDLRLVAYTRGGEGSLLVTAGETSDHPGFPTEVIDTVGAGDSFTATLCMGLLQNLPLAEINQRACRVAAFVCSQSGATPQLPSNLI